MKKTKKLWMLGIVPASIIPFALISCGTSTSTSNENFQAENLTISAKGEIMGFTNPNYNYPETLEIKDKYNGVTITSIADNAFKDKPNLTSLTLPSTLVSIGNQAFANTKLCFVTVPNSVTTIGDNAFMNNSLWYNPNLKLPTKFNNDTQRERIGITLEENSGMPPKKMTKEEMDKVIYGNGPKTAQKFQEFFELPKTVKDNFDVVWKLIGETINQGELTIDRDLASKFLLSSSTTSPSISSMLVFTSLKTKLKDKMPKDYEIIPWGGLGIVVKQVSGNIFDERTMKNSELFGNVLKTKLTTEDQQWVNDSKNLVDENNLAAYSAWEHLLIDLDNWNKHGFFGGYFGWKYSTIQLYKIGMAPLISSELISYFNKEGKLMTIYIGWTDLEKIIRLSWEIDILKLEEKPTLEKEEEMRKYLKQEAGAISDVTIETKIPFTLNVKSTFNTTQSAQEYNAKSISEKIGETFDNPENFNQWYNVVSDIVATKTADSWTFEITWELFQTIYIYDQTGSVSQTMEVYKGEFGNSTFLYDFPTTVVKQIK